MVKIAKSFPTWECDQEIIVLMFLPCIGFLSSNWATED